jgi:hypothetical protein
MPCVLRALPFQDTLSDGGDGWVVSVFDVFEELGEAFVVVLDLGRPVGYPVGVGVVSERGRGCQEA